MPDFNYHGDVVVFDLDDTLAPERDFCRSGFQVIQKKLHELFPGIPFRGVAFRMGTYLNKRKNYFNLLEEILKEKIPTLHENEASLKTLMTELVTLYRNHKPENEKYKLIPGVDALLDELRNRGVVMALVTDGRSITQRRKIEALGLRDYIPQSNIFISEEKDADKTSPENFRNIVREYPEARRFFYIGDNPAKDFIMPNLLGWITCMVPRNYDNVHPIDDSADILKAPAYNLRNMNSILEDFKLSSIKSL